ADVVIADQAEPHGQLCLFGVANGRADAGIGNRHDDVGFDRLLDGEQAAKIGSHLVDALPEYLAIRPREVDVLEDAVREPRGRKRPNRPGTVWVDDDDLARLDVTHVRSVDEIQRARLGADDPRVTEAAERQRAKAVRVARR